MSQCTDVCVGEKKNLDGFKVGGQHYIGGLYISVYDRRGVAMKVVDGTKKLFRPLYSVRGEVERERMCERRARGGGGGGGGGKKPVPPQFSFFGLVVKKKKI